MAGKVKKVVQSGAGKKTSMDVKKVSVPPVKRAK